MARPMVRRDVLDRRQFALGTAAGLAALGLSSSGRAQDQQQAWEQAIKNILGDAKPVEGKITLELPEIAENGNTVPFSVAADSPMTKADNVKAIHIISTANPQPGVATFRFSPLSGRAAASSRMRLARTQEVIAIAELTDGRFLMAKRNVKVTIGGCGG